MRALFRLLTIISLFTIMMSIVSQAQTFKVVYAFQGGTDGWSPNSGVIRDSAGNLYGATELGGGSECNGTGCGSVFKINGRTHQEGLIYSFLEGPDGLIPGTSGLVTGLKSNEALVFGTTQFGGDYSSGSVFQIDSSGNETVLYSFTDGSDGFAPSSGVIRDAAGNLYGVTLGAGNNPCACGTVFEISPRDGGWVETTLHSFAGSGDGENPGGNLLLDSTGNLYGATFNGGAYGYGTIFKIDKNGTETTFHSFFLDSDGAGPNGGLIEDAAGNLYGTVYSGGNGCSNFSCGTVFKLDSAGNETTLHEFRAPPDGHSPLGGLIADKAGNMYGTTYAGGDGRSAGTIFKINSKGQEVVLYSFTGGSDGSGPAAELAMDGAGNLYGTAQYGGNETCNFSGVVYGCGTVFELSAK